MKNSNIVYLVCAWFLLGIICGVCFTVSILQLSINQMLEHSEGIVQNLNIEVKINETKLVEEVADFIGPPTPQTFYSQFKCEPGYICEEYEMEAIKWTK